MKKTTKSVRLEIEQTKERIVISNNLGNSWVLPKNMNRQTVLCILVAQTLWNQFDRESWYRDNFKVTLEIEPLGKE